MRGLFDRFCEEVLLAGAPRGDVAKRVTRAAGFFAALDRGLLEADLSLARLVVLIGAEGMRRWERAVAFVASACGLIWNGDCAVRAREARVARALDAAGRGPMADVVARYTSSLAESRRRATDPGTRATYVRAASGFLAASGCARVADLDGSAVREYLRVRPGHRASLGPFLTWLAASGGPALSVPRRRRPDVRDRERRAMARGQALVRALESTERARTARTLLAAALSVLYQVPLEHVLALRWDDVLAGGRPILWPTGARIALEGRVAVEFGRWAAPTRWGFVFPGRSGLKPLSTSAVARCVEHATGHPKDRHRRVRAGATTRPPAGQTGPDQDSPAPAV